MKIIEKSLPQDYKEANDGCDEYSITVNGEKRIEANDYGEPEDNTLGRDLNFVYSIVGLMREAYEAGKKGEEFEVIKVQEHN